jgi:hypothetical protein
MEIVSRLSSHRYPLSMDIYPYLYDHNFEGKAVFPAVESLITLARAVKSHFPQAAVDSMAAASFPRFLVIPQEAKFPEMFVDIDDSTGEGINAALLSSVTSKTAGIRRTVEHARVRFNAVPSADVPSLPRHLVEKLEGECINVPAAAIYRELVPFGAAYHNISGDLSVSPAGALAFLSGGGNVDADDDLLGSPFPFDAAMHAACVWAQRFTDVVAFPTGFAKRIIYEKTKLNGNYLGRILPVKFDAEPFIFNAWIFDLQGNVC